MEQNMKSICEGRNSKSIVIRNVCESYRSAFVIAQQQLDRMLGSFSDLMRPIPEDQIVQNRQNNGEFIRHCPKCSLMMYLRTIRPNEPKKMVGCSGFPTCKECVWIPEAYSDISVIEQLCETCSIDDLPVKKVQSISQSCILCLWCDASVGNQFKRISSADHGGDSHATLQDENTPK
jgi:DNA topoisomerase-3